MKLKKPIKTGFIAELIDGKLNGDPEILIEGLNRIEDAKNGEATFLSDASFGKYLSQTGASCILINSKFDYEPRPDIVFIVVDNAYSAFIKLIEYFYRTIPGKTPLRHSTATVEPTAEIAWTSYIGAGCYVGANTRIAENVILHPNSTVMENCTIGAGTVIFSNAVICNDTIIGANCTIHPGVVIGGDGFGFTENKDGSFNKIPQIGNVVIGDDVEIGANSSIDRAMVGSTVIERGVKIDNLVQVGHNTIIGENTGIVSQVGVSGSVKIGKRNRLGGQVGIAGHLETGDDVTLLAQSGIAKTVTKKGVYFGSPAKEYLPAFRIEAAMRNLPQLLKEFNQLKNTLKNSGIIKE